MVGQAIIPGNSKRRYKRCQYDSGVLIYWFTVITCIPSNRLLMSKLEVIYRRFFQFWLIFPNQNYQSRSKEYNLNLCWYRTLPLKKKRSLSSKIWSKHQEQQRFSAAWRHCWLACLLSQVARTSPPGSRRRQLFPFLPNPRTGLLIPLKKLLYGQCWKVLSQFFVIMRG